jgi:hypothetical protein
VNGSNFVVPQSNGFLQDFVQDQSLRQEGGYCQRQRKAELTRLMMIDAILTPA